MSVRFEDERLRERIHEKSQNGKYVKHDKNGIQNREFNKMYSKESKIQKILLSCEVKEL